MARTETCPSVVIVIRNRFQLKKTTTPKLNCSLKLSSNYYYLSGKLTSGFEPRPSWRKGQGSIAWATPPVGWWYISIWERKLTVSPGQWWDRRCWFWHCWWVFLGHVSTLLTSPGPWRQSGSSWCWPCPGPNRRWWRARCTCRRIGLEAQSSARHHWVIEWAHIWYKAYAC